MLVLALASAMDPAVRDEPRFCPMGPAHAVIELPESGFSWLEGEEIFGQCGSVPEEAWSREAWGSQEVVVYADGPSGSGRYWQLSVGMAPEGGGPLRGVCLVTTTVGWRTLQRWDRVPLPWVDDLDENGEPEVLIWASFPLSREPSMAEFGLVAWVYDLGPDGLFTINWDLSRRMAAEIGAAYREPLEGMNTLTAGTRGKAAVSLERFAAEECKTAVSFRVVNQHR